MTAPLPSLRLLSMPTTIPGDAINLWSMTQDVWPHVQKLSMAETKFMDFEVGKADTAPSHFTDQTRYAELCVSLLTRDPDFADLEPAHHYWMHAPKTDKLVGVILASTSLFNPDVLLISYATLPDHRKQGHATAAATLLSDFIMEKDIAPFAGAGVSSTNTYSRSVLGHAGFQEVANELLSSEIASHGMRHLIKSKGPAHAWPSKLKF